MSPEAGLDVTAQPAGTSPRVASGGAARRRRRAWLWIALALVVPPLVVRGLLFEVYRVQSGSMEPTFHPGDHLVVLKRWIDARELQRWDAVVVDSEVAWESPEGVDTLVKRIVGLPDESIRLRDGDVYVRPHAAGSEALELVRKPDDLVAQLLVPVHAAGGLAAPWVWAGAGSRVELDGGGTRLDAPGPPGEAVFERPVDDRLADEGDDVDAEAVADTALRLVVGQVSGVLMLSLREGADVFRARLAPAERGGASLHHNLAVPGVVASVPDFGGLAPGAEVLMWNVDNGVRVLVDGAPVLAYDYAANAHRAPGTPIRNEPRLAIEGGSVELLSVTVARDLHFTGRGNFGGDSSAGITPCPLGPDELFLVGDHSRRSQDSRSFGPVSTSALRGRAVAICLPWSRIARLAATGLPE